VDYKYAYRTKYAYKKVCKIKKVPIGRVRYLVSKKVYYKKKKCHCRNHAKVLIKKVYKTKYVDRIKWKIKHVVKTLIKKVPVKVYINRL